MLSRSRLVKSEFALISPGFSFIPFCLEGGPSCLTTVGEIPFLNAAIPLRGKLLDGGVTEVERCRWFVVRN